MKVLLVNGSSRKDGNTATALTEVARTLEAEGLETETLWLGTKPVNDCIACGKCSELDNRCAFDNDIVNELIEKAEGSDAFVFGTPVYYAHPSGRILCALDRAFYAGNDAFCHKPGAAIAVARRGGTTASFDVLNKYFTINQMPVVASTYWNNVHGCTPGEAVQDEEGLRTMRNLAHNMAWILRCIEAGKAAGIEAPYAERGPATNFIR
ncbi:flavodoxin family protein [uncultured Parolsenella sp.]|uniref:flavodoxin family protein n=1 Tax=uncultured Parolsenella sp. TaxID=2083008 RepID=UPI0025E6DC62|nr:flavodoxin family protein [uncultured Parolsenella sp.]